MQIAAEINRLDISRDDRLKIAKIIQSSFKRPDPTDGGGKPYKILAQENENYLDLIESLVQFIGGENK
jgi:hypothetical protein